MSKFIKTLVLGSLFAIAGTAYAGSNITGTVYTNSAKTYMYGSFDVRYNYSSSVNKEYIGGYTNTNNSLSFRGYDQTNGYFSCSIAYSSLSTSLYQKAQDIMLNLTNGAYLYVTKRSGTNRCAFVALTKDSRYL